MDGYYWIPCHCPLISPLIRFCRHSTSGNSLSFCPDSQRLGEETSRLFRINSCYLQIFFSIFSLIWFTSCHILIKLGFFFFNLFPTTHQWKCCQTWKMKCKIPLESTSSWDHVCPGLAVFLGIWKGCAVDVFFLHSHKSRKIWFIEIALRAGMTIEVYSKGWMTF